MRIFVVGALSLMLLPATARSASEGLVISQVYGGGQTSSGGAPPYAQDYVELFNRGPAAVDTTGMSVQYAGPTSTTWNVTPLGTHSVAPGQYLLVGEQLGTTGGAALPAPDVNGGISVGQAAGRFALVSRTALLECGATCAGSPWVVDFVGYGATPDFEGTASASGVVASTAGFRAAGGCTDTDDNGADFAAAAPQPRNSATTIAACASARTPELLLVSRSGLDGPGGDGQSGDAPYGWSGVTPAGTLAVFSTQAANLRPPGFTAGTDTSDVILRDLETGANDPVSIPDGPPPDPLTGPLGDGASGGPSVSADGRRVAFLSDAPDLTTTTYPRRFQAWVRDRQDQTTRLVSRTGAAAADENVQTASISADGSTVVFATAAQNLDPTPDGETDVFVHDLASGTTSLASTLFGGGYDPAISADGQVVAYAAQAGCPLVCDLYTPPHVVVFKRSSQQTTEAGVATGGAAANAPTFDASISADGRFVSFVSAATNLGGTNDGGFNAFVRDLRSGVTYPVTPGPEQAEQALISPDGGKVAVLNNGYVFLADIHDASLRAISAGDAARILGVSRDAGTVTFSAAARGLAPGTDPANDLDVFARVTVGGVPVNTQAPDIAGTPQVGLELTCLPGVWTEHPNQFSYRWLLDGTAVDGATALTYTPPQAAENKSVACRVVASNAAGEGAAADSVALVVDPNLPVVVTPPTLDGTPQPGSTLTCGAGVFSGEVDSVAYRWMRSSGGGPYAAIDGATGTTYVVQDVDVGSRVLCEEIATNANGSRSARSPSKAVAAGIPVSTGIPVVTGTFAVGEPLQCSPGTWDNQPLRFTYQWLRDGQPIALATNAARTASAADREQRLSCEVIASNDVGTSVPAVSDGHFIAGAKPSNTTKPGLSLAQVGSKPTDYRATCTPGQWRDAPGDFAYVISYSDGAPVGSSATYDTKAADLGRELICTVFATNALGSTSASSNTVTVPLPPVDPTAGKAEMHMAGGVPNEFAPVNFLAIAPGSADQLRAQAVARVQAAFTTFVADCKTRTLAPGLPDADPRKIVNKDDRERELCRLILNTPANQFVVASDGVRIVADASKCVLGDDDPCARLPIPMPAANPVPAVGIDPGLEPVNILWDFDSDGQLDASCSGQTPVVRTIFDKGNYNVRAILVLPDSEATGRYPSVTLTLEHYTKDPPPNNLTSYYSPSRGTQLSAHFRSGVVGPPTNLPTSPSLKLGKLRKAQPFACKSQLQPPAEPSQPCVSEGYAGRIHVRGNLCPISLRSVPRAELSVIETSDPELYALLKEQNDAMGVSRRSAVLDTRLRRSATDFAGAALSDFAASKPSAARLTTSVASQLTDAKQAPRALDQIYVANGAVNLNGVDLKPTNSSRVLFVPSDAGGALNAVKNMVVSSSQAKLGLGTLPLSSTAEKFKADLIDAANDKATEFARTNLDALKNKLDLGPFKLAGDAQVSLVDGVAELEAQAELPALTTGPGASPIRVGFKARADQFGRLQLTGVRLQAGLAYLGAVKVKDLDLLYDGGLSVTGKLLFPPVDAGIEIERFRISSGGDLQALIVNYLAGAGQGIPVGPGIFLTKLGGGLSLDPDEIKASAAVSVGPSAGGGCPVIGGNGSILVHFDPPPFTLSSNIDMGLACLTLTNVSFLARSDGYATLKGSLGFDGGPLYFNAFMQGSVLLPAWQVEGGGTGGIRRVLSGDVQAVLSARGLAGCGTVDLGLTDISGGAGVRFTPGLLQGGALAILANVRLFTGCDLSSFKTVVPPGRAAGPDVRPVSVTAGSDVLALSAEGLGAAPRVVLKDPAGAVVADLSGAADTVRTQSVLALRAEDEDRTLFLVGRPAAGTWSVEGPGVVRLQRAGKLPPVRIRAHVTGRGPRRVLRYAIAREPGQVVRFAESAEGGGQLLKEIKGGGTGSFEFTVADASGSARQIVAQVSQDDLPRDNVVVARFRAPSPRVGRPRRVRIARTGRISWRPARFARSYEVVVTRADGSRTLIDAGRRRAVTVRRARGALVTALGVNGRRSRPVPARRARAGSGRRGHRRRGA